MGEVARVPLTFGIGVQYVEVLGVLGVGAASQQGIAVEQGAAVERREQPLVGVDDETVGTFDATEPVAHARCQKAGAAVRPVDVEPHTQLVGNVGRRGKVVDDTGVGGATRGHDGEHPITVDGVERGHGGPQVLDVEPALGVGRNLHLIGVHRPAGLSDAAVSALGRDDQAPGAVLATASAFAPAVAGSYQGAEVARRAATDEDPSRLGGEPSSIGQIAQRLVLGEHGAAALHPGAAIDAARPDDEVEEDARFGGGGRHE